MTVTCEIELENNPSKAIYSGQMLRGIVNLTFSKDRVARGIYIRVTGQGYTLWGSGDDTYGARENYFNQLMYLIGGDRSEVRLPPGSYKYPFEFFLPAGLPTSIEGSHGKIKYKMTVVIKNTSLWRDKEFDIPFSVIKALDLNTLPMLRNPSISIVNKTFFPCFLLCCFTSNPLQIVARTPISGYVPGQIIDLEIITFNKSNVDITKFTVELIKAITYHGTRRRNQITEKIAILKERIIKYSVIEGNKVFTVSVEVPWLQPTDETSSQIIKVQYYFRITGSAHGDCHADPKLKLPINIGTHALIDELSNQPTYAPTTEAPLQYQYTNSVFKL